MKRVLTIAGSDSGGGAGIQADLKTITVLGGFGMSVLCALTAQNTKGITAIHSLPPKFIEQQLDAVLADIGADAVKTGMLFDGPTIETVAGKLAAYGIERLVVDPVMVAKGGDVLLVDAARETLARHLVPMSFVLTPNIPEAEVLTGRRIRTDAEARDAARILHRMGARHVLIKGGHLDGPAKDLLFDGAGFFEFSKKRIQTPHTHGTGCVYSAAIATYLAKGLDVKEAVSQAKEFVHTAIRFALPLGKGHGPTNLYARFARSEARYDVLEDLKKAFLRLQRLRAGSLVPEVQSNLGYALPFAETQEDVAAFPARLVRLGEEIVAVAGPAFGASRHVATIILTAMRYHADLRSVMNIRFSQAILDKCLALGWEVASFDRSEEPKEVKEKEGGTLEWGTAQVLSRRASAPDVIFDLGDVGKEPMIRILGRHPEDVVDKVAKLL